MRPLVALSLLLLAGCGGGRSAYENAIAAGDRAKTGGRYDEAAAAYREAGVVGSTQFHRDEGRYLEAASLQQAGRHREAMAAYDSLLASSPTGDRAARATFERAWLEIEHGDAEAGWKSVERAIFEHGQSGVAPRAIRKLVAHLDEKQPGAGRAWLEANRERLLQTKVGEDALYLTAKALRAEGKLGDARRLFAECIQRYPYPQGTLFDDAWWHLSEIDEQLGDPRQAIDDLRKLLAPREISTLGQGSYERPRYSSAQMRIAELYRDKLNDEAQARREFRKFYAEHKTSVMRSSAVWSEALLARKARDEAAACELAGILAREFAESRYAGCVSLLCATAKAPDKAPACRGYLRSALGEPAP